MSHKTLTVRTHAQRTLLKMELLGQLSDGHWENTRPYNHWEPWADAEILVGQNVGRNFFARKVAYRLDDKKLLEVVGRRMKVYVRLAHHYGLKATGILEGFLDIDGNWAGEPTYQGAYWDKKRRRLAVEMVAILQEHGHNVDDVKAIAENETAYSDVDLKTDLRDLRNIFKMRMGGTGIDL